MVVVVTAASAIWTGVINDNLSETNARLADSQKEIEQTQTCTAGALGRLLESLNERTALTGPVNEADTKQNETLADILDLTLRNPPPSREEGRRVLTDWKAQLDKYLGLRKQQGASQEANPFPSNFGFQACLDQAKKEKE